MKKFILIFLLVAACCMPSFSFTFYRASDPAFSYVGRYTMSASGVASWTWPYFQFYTQFTGTSAVMKVKPSSGSFMVELDGEEPFRVESSKDSSMVVLARNLSAGTHKLHVAYCVEGYTHRPQFYGLLVDDGAKLSQATLPPHKMEFIGNSITCALGNMWNGEKPYTQKLQNIYYSYEAIACRALNAQCQVVARSGLGMYRNTLGNPNGDKNVMPVYYPHVNFSLTGELWDFPRYQPDVVCVNLGTNDTTNPKYYVDKLADAYKAFVSQLREHYPHAKIVLLTGTMIKGKRLADVQTALNEVVEAQKQKGDNEVYRFDFTPADGSLGYGYAKHPSKRQHEQMAAELVPFIKKITNW